MLTFKRCLLDETMKQLGRTKSFQGLDFPWLFLLVYNAFFTKKINLDIDFEGKYDP
jgi:hypothetical protein